MAYTTDDLTSALEDAYDAWQAAPSDIAGLCSIIRSAEVASSSLINPAGTITGTSANGRSSQIVFDGRTPGSITTKEQANCRRALNERLRYWADWIQQCLNYGLDPLITESNGPPATLPALLNNPQTLTVYQLLEWLLGTQWARYKTGFQAKTITGAAGFNNWPAHLFRVTERMSDYSLGRSAGAVFA